MLCDWLNIRLEEPWLYKLTSICTCQFSALTLSCDHISDSLLDRVIEAAFQNLYICILAWLDSDSSIAELQNLDTQV